MTARVGRGARLKGYNYQRLIYDYLRARGFKPIRRSIGEAGDDITVVDLPHISIETKNVNQRSLGTWWHQAKSNAQGRIPVIVMKRTGVAAASDQWVLLTLEEFLNLIERTGMDPEDEEVEVEEDSDTLPLDEVFIDLPEDD